MIDAFGAYGYEGTPLPPNPAVSRLPAIVENAPLNKTPPPRAGPFRKSSELALGLLRQNEDTLMTILETFLYDPTTDFIGKKVSLQSTPTLPPSTLYQNTHAFPLRHRNDPKVPSPTHQRACSRASGIKSAVSYLASPSHCRSRATCRS